MNAYPHGYMLGKLFLAEDSLPALIERDELWQTVYVDYHKPFVELVWFQWGVFRISLHCIHPCTPEEALNHWHSWAAGFRVRRNSYESGFGVGSGPELPPIEQVRVFTAGECHEMINPREAHYVAPRGEPVDTTMVSGFPWDRKGAMSTKQLGELSTNRKATIMQEAYDWYIKHNAALALLP